MYEKRDYVRGAMIHGGVHKAHSGVPLLKSLEPPAQPVPLASIAAKIEDVRHRLTALKASLSRRS